MASSNKRAMLNNWKMILAALKIRSWAYSRSDRSWWASRWPSLTILEIALASRQDRFLVLDNRGVYWSILDQILWAFRACSSSSQKLQVTLIQWRKIVTNWTKERLKFLEKSTNSRPNWIKFRRKKMLFFSNRKLPATWAPQTRLRNSIRKSQKGSTSSNLRSPKTFQTPRKSSKIWCKTFRISSIITIRLKKISMTTKPKFRKHWSNQKRPRKSKEILQVSSKLRSSSRMSWSMRWKPSNSVWPPMSSKLRGSSLSMALFSASIRNAKSKTSKVIWVFSLIISNVIQRTSCPVLTLLPNQSFTRLWLTRWKLQNRCLKSIRRSKVVLSTSTP